MDPIDNTMNIKPTRADLNQGSQQTGRVSSQSSSDSSKDSAASVSAGDTVTFTNTAAEMLKLEETLASLPDIDDNRVASIKASIAEGSYQVDPEKIVDNLLNLERDLL